MSNFPLMKPAGNGPFWLDTLFNSAFGQMIGNDLPASSPSVNIIDKENSFELQLAAPGMDKSDFNVQVINDQLVVSAEKKTESSEERPKYMRKEFMYTSFKRSFNLHQQIETDKIEASYENGILKLHLPKKEDVVKLTTPTKVEIK